MAGRTPLDSQVSGTLEDIVLDKLSPNLGKTDHDAEDNAHDGGTDKAAPRPTPFKLKEG